MTDENVFQHKNFTHQKIQHENFPNYGISDSSAVVC